MTETQTQWRQRLTAVLLETYPSRVEIDEVLRLHGMNLEEIAPTPATLGEVISRLVEWMVARGRTEEILGVLAAARPERPDLQQLLREIPASIERSRASDESGTRDSNRARSRWRARIVWVVCVLALLAALPFAICREPVVRIRVTESPRFVGEDVAHLVDAASQPGSTWCRYLPTGRRSMRTTGISTAAESLVICRTTFDASSRDPAALLETLASRIPCLRVAGVSASELRVSIDETLARSVTTRDGRSFWLCGCTSADTMDVLNIVNR